MQKSLSLYIAGFRLFCFVSLAGGLVFCAEQASADWAEAMGESSGITRDVVGEAHAGESTLRNSLTTEMSRDISTNYGGGVSGGMNMMAVLHVENKPFSGGGGTGVMGIFSGDGPDGADAPPHRG